MEKRPYSLTGDEKKDMWAKAIVSFVFIGMSVTLLFFFTLIIDDEKTRWDQYIIYFGRIVNPAGTLVWAFLAVWSLALIEYHQYLKKNYTKKSSARILVTKIADKAYDLFPRLFLAMGGCILVTSLLEFTLVPHNSNFWIYLLFQLLICGISSVVGFKMLLPRRLMLNTLIMGWVQFVRNVSKIWFGLVCKKK
ncbi:hypothetical protein [Buttiauxella gaviniae]|uniref:hypothetical protein n=1 Tax=Buttiauxella gaviniae TaxID=82990 RepID=UPI003BB5B139